MDMAIEPRRPPEAAQEQPAESQRPPMLVPSDTTPREFYAEITKRADVRAILEELVTG